MQRLGAALPLQNLPPGQQVAYIRRAEASGYEGIWVPEVMGTDAFTIVFSFSYEADPFSSVMRTLQAIPTA